MRHEYKLHPSLLAAVVVVSLAVTLSCYFRFKTAQVEAGSYIDAANSMNRTMENMRQYKSPNAAP